MYNIQPNIDDELQATEREFFLDNEHWFVPLT